MRKKVLQAGWDGHHKLDLPGDKRGGKGNITKDLGTKNKERKGKEIGN